MYLGTFFPQLFGWLGGPRCQVGEESGLQGQKPSHGGAWGSEVWDWLLKGRGGIPRARGQEAVTSQRAILPQNCREPVPGVRGPPALVHQMRLGKGGAK